MRRREVVTNNDFFEQRKEKHHLSRKAGAFIPPLKMDVAMELAMWRRTAPGDPVFQTLLDERLLGDFGEAILHQREIRRRGLEDRYQKLCFDCNGKLTVVPCDAKGDYPLLEACLIGALKRRDMHCIVTALNMIGVTAGLALLPAKGRVDVMDDGGWGAAGVPGLCVARQEWTVPPVPGSGLFTHTAIHMQQRRDVELRLREMAIDISVLSVLDAAQTLVRAISPPTFLHRPLLFRCVSASLAAPEKRFLHIRVSALLEGDCIVGQPDNEQWVEKTRHRYGGMPVLDWKPRGLDFVVEREEEEEERLSHV